MASRRKKFFFIFTGLAVFVFLLLIIVNHWFGVFSPVKITREVRGPYLMVYMPHRGAYHLVREKVKKVGKMLDERKIPKTIPCALFHDDPRDSAVENLRSEGGYLVGQPLSLEHPFGQQEIPGREVILATIKAHPLVAPFRVYSRVVEFMKMHQLAYNGPALERYLPEGIVEVEIPYQSSNLRNFQPMR